MTARTTWPRITGPASRPAPCRFCAQGDQLQVVHAQIIQFCAASSLNGTSSSRHERVLLTGATRAFPGLGRQAGEVDGIVSAVLFAGIVGPPSEDAGQVVQGHRPQRAV